MYFCERLVLSLMSSSGSVSRIRLAIVVVSSSIEVGALKKVYQCDFLFKAREVYNTRFILFQLW